MGLDGCRRVVVASGNSPNLKRTKMTKSWRQSTEYQRAIEVAFAPYQACLIDPEIPREYYYCAFCGEVRHRDQLDPCHVFKAKTYPQIRTEWKNILPGCKFPYECHRAFDLKPPEVRKAIIEDVLPDGKERVAELEAMIRVRSSPKARYGKWER